MDRIVYWQPVQKQTCTTQSTIDNCVRLIDGAQHAAGKPNHDLITFLPEHKVLLCTQCKVAVPSNDLDSHLRASHKGVRKSTRESIRETFADVPAARITADLQPLPDGSPPSPFLVPARRGFYCPACLTFRSFHEREIRHHSVKVHGHNTKPTEVQKNACYLQGWIKRRVVQSTRYWIVDMSAGSTPCCPENCDQSKDPQQNAETELLQLEAEEENRLCREPEIVIQEDLETDEDSEWIRACNWTTWFKHKPIPLLIAATMVPAPSCPSAFYLGKWHGVECSSPAESERVLQLIVIASRAVIERCVKTLQHTPRTLRCWTQSSSSSFSPYPFDCPRPPTLKRYTRIWSSAICYFFRMWDQERRLKEHTAQLCGIEFTPDQRGCMRSVWSRFERLTSCRGSHELLSIPQEEIEAVMQLSILFWTERPKDANLESTAVARFSGILGIHPEEHAFRRAYDYTPLLSALIWIGRALLVEYALPLESYETLSQRWPAREEHPDMFQRLRYDIRSRFMERGCIAPLGYLVERRQHGRAIARREGPRTNMEWSKDGHSLSFDNQSITITQFRQVIHGVTAQTQYLLDGLLFHWWPEIDLDLRDDLGNRRPGYSFLTDPQNHLQGNFRLLSQRVFAKDGGLSWTSPSQLLGYLRKCDRFVQFLFSAIHTTSGMPAKGVKLRSIRWSNTLVSLRNVVCFQGRLIVIFAYNKACTTTNNSFYVMRAPSPAVEKMLFVFLVYLRPLRDMIARRVLFDEELTPAKEPNRHIFSKHDQATSCYNSDDCLRSLKLATAQSPMIMTMRNYRQVAIAMSKKHIPGLLKPFDPHLPNDVDGFLSLLSFQTGHKPATRVGSYASENAFPSKLQPDLIHRYLENSDVWQKFLMISKDDYVEWEMPTAPVSNNLDPSETLQMSPKFAPRLGKLPCNPPLTDIHNGSHKARGRIW